MPTTSSSDPEIIKKELTLRECSVHNKEVSAQAEHVIAAGWTERDRLRKVQASQGRVPEQSTGGGDSRESATEIYRLISLR